MYSQRTNYVLIGCFVISMVIAIIVSLALITGRTGASDTYYVVLDNVADIKYGTQVRYEGFPVGQVEEITPEPDGARMRFRVEARAPKTRENAMFGMPTCATGARRRNHRMFRA